ncbi:S9 family peptidase [Ammoniphilus sp. CFH 90114]|uniref:alpha/beta hydrolase family protein n=1 Tax=Ammoniphilus sp. CFH 90114 TaxID=2493665 RepID=UPI00100F7B20|nr:alpha/beta hydrolase [Ammoniphilus sp. CFH 90114]RXT14856.1 alpha/beta hydrolase [Ammoniphilus sp. CFH 90114]
MKNVSVRPFSFSLSEDLTLRGDVHTLVDDRVKPIVVLCHGFKGFKDWGFFPYIADQLAAEGHYVIRFNFTCNGVNETDFDELDKFSMNTYSREQADLHYLLQQIKKRELPLEEQYSADSITLIGHSRGGGNSIIFAADHPEITKVITWNGIANVDLFDDGFKKEINEKGIGYIPNARTKQDMPIRSIVLEDIAHNNQKFNIIKRVSELNIPLLIIQGDQDIPRLVEGARLIQKASNQGLVVIEGGNHTFGAVHPFQGSTPQLDKALQDTLQFLQS